MLAYDYASRRALLHDPVEGEVPPHLYALCTPCAEKLVPPRGWTLEDHRTAPPLFIDELEEAFDQPAVESPSEANLERSGRQLFFGSSG